MRRLQKPISATHVKVRVWAIAGNGPPFEAVFRVAPGSIDCLAPRQRLEELGVRPEGTKKYELPSGEIVEYRYGFVRLSFLGKETVSQIAFGPADAEPLLGQGAILGAGFRIEKRTTNDNSEA